MKLGVVVIPATTLLTAGRTAGSARSRPRAGGGGDAGPGRQVRQSSRRASSSASSSARVRRSRAGCRSSRPRSFRKRSRRTDRPTPTIRCCSISPRARRRSQSWCATASAAIPSARCRPCTGSACSRATCISTSPRRAGPSMPGAASSRRGMPGATIFIVNQPRFEAKQLLATHRPLRRHHALRAADGVAAVHPGAACRLQGQPARGLRRRRAAQSRSHRPGARRLGPHHPRRLRPDRDHRARRQLAGAEGQGRLDGPAAAGLSRADHGCRRTRRRRKARCRWCSAPIARPA